MKLYFKPGACSLSPHITLQELGLPFEAVQVDTKAGKTASGADFRAINPKGAVPALQLDDGQVLTEGPAIVQYLADRKPEAGLAPKAGSLERYRLMEALNYVGTELHKTYGTLFNPANPESVLSATREALLKKYQWLDQQLAGKQFWLGDQFTVADAYLFTVTRWAPRVKLELGQLANLQAYLARVGARPAVKAAMKAEGLS